LVPNATSRFAVPSRLPTLVDRGALTVAAVCLVTALASAQAAPGGVAQPPSAGDAPLRTFELVKPVDPAAPSSRAAIPFAPSRLPVAHDSLKTSIGLGYVQGADWGSELIAGGAFAGAQVQASALVTRGSQGLVFDHGSLMIFEPDARWRVEAGDIFSNLRGAAIGGRFSWSARWGRRPAIAVYAPYRGGDERGTVLAYRDQLVVRGQTVLDAELATDKSYLLRSRLAVPRLEIEATYRAQTEPSTSEDGNLSASVGIGRGVVVSASAFRTFAGADPAEWNSVAVRLPLGRHFDFTVERAFAGSDTASQSTFAAMAGLSAGNLRAFHRHQFGAYDFIGSGSARTVERQQTQSMTSYRAGRHANFTLQLATQRADNGQVRHWEELHSLFRVTRTTSVRTVTAIPDMRDLDRFQANVRQELPSGFALHADYGRISAYQPIPAGLDRPRFKLMVFKTIDLATPARGAEVKGTVTDNTGRAVAGARVKLGPYATQTDASGTYVFRHVPRGQYELTLDQDLLPADFAWDGRGEAVATRPGARIGADLRVTPLNALHGRVYVDRDGNGRYDAGEGVPGAVLQLGGRLTAADQQGAYSFFNVWPGTYTIQLHALPPDYTGGPMNERTVTLLDGRPVTGADFTVRARIKSIIWEGDGR
jgi:hypothetical protein